MEPWADAKLRFNLNALNRQGADAVDWDQILRGIIERIVEITRKFQHKVDVLKQHCEKVGRDFNEIALSTQVRVDYDDLTGARERTQSFIDAGATHFVYTLSYPYPADIVTRLADEVVGAVQGQGC